MDAQELTFEAGHNEADLVHVGGQHQPVVGFPVRRTSGALEGDEVAHGIGPHLIRQGLPQLGQRIGNGMLVSRWSTNLRELLEKF